MLTPPEPKRGGTFVYCPMVDVWETERTGTLALCNSQYRSRFRAEKAYRRHWQRVHGTPFVKETHALMRFIAKGEWAGTPAEAEVTVSK